jgi:hypothetical protein
MPHGKKAASKTPIDAYVDGCHATWISIGHPTRISRRSSSRRTSRLVNASGSRRLPSLDCRAWKGHSNPLLLSTLRFAPESRAVMGDLVKDRPRKQIGIGHRSPFVPRCAKRRSGRSWRRGVWRRGRWPRSLLLERALLDGSNTRDLLVFALAIRPMCEEVQRLHAVDIAPEDIGNLACSDASNDHAHSQCLYCHN